LVTFFWKLGNLWDNVEKYDRARQATDDSIMWSIRDAWIETFIIFHTHFFSMAAMVTWMCLSVMLYVRCLSCFSSQTQNLTTLGLMGYLPNIARGIYCFDLNTRWPLFTVFISRKIYGQKMFNFMRDCRVNPDPIFRWWIREILYLVHMRMNLNPIFRQWIRKKIMFG